MTVEESRGYGAVRAPVMGNRLHDCGFVGGVFLIEWLDPPLYIIAIALAVGIIWFKLDKIQTAVKKKSEPPNDAEHKNRGGPIDVGPTDRRDRTT